MNGLIKAHLEPKTHQNYEYGKRKLMRWLHASGRVLTEKAFLDFVADCQTARLSYHVPNFARSWLALYEKVKFNRQIITASFRVKMALEGYRRLDARRERVRSPISSRLLRRLIQPTVPKPTRMLFLLSYIFLLRVSEALSVAQGQGTVKKTTKGYVLFLPKSKADPEGRGVSVFFRKSEVPADLVSLLDKLIKKLPLQVCPSPPDLNACVHSVLGASYTFHSLRHGRATDLFKEGMTLPRLMSLGRWTPSQPSRATCTS